MKTPITYYGGKQSMLKHILPLIPWHRVYNEPFFGGGAVFFAKRPSEIEFINEINGELVNFYRTIKRDFDNLKVEVDCTLHSEFQHKQARDIYFNETDKNAVMRAWAVWVLSSQSYLSMLSNSWALSTDRSFAKTIKTKKEAFSEVYVKRLESVSIFCRDALKAISNVDKPDTFHYVDPPYFNSDCGHYKGYSLEDFKNLLNLLSIVKGKFMLSSYPSNILSEYTRLNNWTQIEFDMDKAAGDGRKTEVITMNYRLDDMSVERNKHGMPLTMTFDD